MRARIRPAPRRDRRRQHAPVMLGIPCREPARQGPASAATLSATYAAACSLPKPAGNAYSLRPISDASQPSSRHRCAIAANSSGSKRARSTIARQHMSSASPIRTSQAGRGAQSERPGRTALARRANPARPTRPGHPGRHRLAQPRRAAASIRASHPGSGTPSIRTTPPLAAIAYGIANGSRSLASLLTLRLVATQSRTCCGSPARQSRAA